MDNERLKQLRRVAAMGLMTGVEQVAVLDALEAAVAGQEEARTYARKMHRLARIVTCVYCGHEYPEGVPASAHSALTEHIRECPGHPMRVVEAELSVAKAQIQRLVAENTSYQEAAAIGDRIDDSHMDRMVEITELRAQVQSLAAERDRAIELRDAINAAKTPASAEELGQAQMAAAVAIAEKNAALAELQEVREMLEVHQQAHIQSVGVLEESRSQLRLQLAGTKSKLAQLQELAAHLVETEDPEVAHALGTDILDRIRDAITR